MLSNKNVTLSCSHWSCTIFYFNLILFVHIGHANFDLFDVQYLQNVVSIFEKGLNGQYLSLSDSHHPINPTKISLQGGIFPGGGNEEIFG